jgi:hypothetical protein
MAAATSRNAIPLWVSQHIEYGQDMVVDVAPGVARALHPVDSDDSLSHHRTPLARNAIRACESMLMIAAGIAGAVLFLVVAGLFISQYLSDRDNNHGKSHDHVMRAPDNFHNVQTIQDYQDPSHSLPSTPANSRCWSSSRSGCAIAESRSGSTSVRAPSSST